MLSSKVEKAQLEDYCGALALVIAKGYFLATVTSIVCTIHKLNSSVKIQFSVHRERNFLLK